MDNNKGGWKQEMEVRRAGVVGMGGKKRQKTVPGTTIKQNNQEKTEWLFLNKGLVPTFPSEAEWQTVITSQVCLQYEGRP